MAHLLLADEDELISDLTIDCNMPEMTGVELLQAITGDKDFSRVPMLMLTARQIGADDYLIKPAVLDELLNRVENLLPFCTQSNGMDRSSLSGKPIPYYSSDGAGLA